MTPKVKCWICGITRETNIKRYGKFKGDMCKECQEDMAWTRTCIKLSTDWIMKKFPGRYVKNYGPFGELTVTDCRNVKNGVP